MIDQQQVDVRVVQNRKDLINMRNDLLTTFKREDKEQQKAYVDGVLDMFNVAFGLL